MLSDDELKKMRKWKDGLTGGGLLFIGEKQLMKIRVRKTFFELPFVTSTCVASVHEPSGHNYRKIWQAVITFFPKKLIAILSSIDD